MGAGLALSITAPIVLVGLLALTVVPVNLQVTVTDTALVVEPRGLDLLWTLRRRIVVPLDEITGVRVVPRTELSRSALRLPGTYLPGVIIAGSYGTGAERTFWDVRHAAELVVIECRVGFEYRAIVLEFPDPYAVLARTATVLSHTV